MCLVFILSLESELNAKFSSQVETLGAESPLTSLVPPLRGVHPDEAFSSIPYEKGHTFLYYLEELLGGPGGWDSSNSEWP